MKRGSKPFDVYTIDKKYVGTWINKTKCAKQLGLQPSNMRKVLNGQNTHTKGYILKYKE